jgi:tryptophan synthase alpha subunit
LESTTKKLLDKPQFAKGAIIGSAFIQDLTKMEPEKLTLSLMRSINLLY